MSGRVWVQSTHPYTFYGRRVWYWLRSVHSWDNLFQDEVEVWGPPLKCTPCLSAAPCPNRLGTSPPMEDLTAAGHNHEIAGPQVMPLCRLYVCVQIVFSWPLSSVCHLLVIFYTVLVLCLWLPLLFYYYSTSMTPWLFVNPHMYLDSWNAI